MARSVTAPRWPDLPVEVVFPDLARWAAGNTGTPYVWRFDGAQPGPSVVVQALTHGNEVCGAIALDWLLGLAPPVARGALTVIFANTDAHARWDPARPFRSRCVDEDFNRLWAAGELDAPRDSVERRRARLLRPFYDAAAMLLDLHSMTDPCPPLALAGPRTKGEALARAVGLPRDIVVDGGHAAGRRLRDYAFFDAPDDPRAALLVECGQHWERAAPEVARQCTLRFLRHCGTLADAFVAEHLDPAPLPPQRTLDVTDAVTIETTQFEFAIPVSGLAVVPRAGTLLARDGAREIRTPYDDCVLIMPTRNPRRGETAVRLGRYRG
ncbi:MAG: succinylglutamate desuccinylase/aspartoacylase family protein [Proteobacteria bacterium]|nr:succinylglutamate desuccinylase/aspartoacylase family protein [Pseudomonadota bacterium]